MPSSYHSWTHATLRIAAGILFLQHGLQKIFGAFGGVEGSTVPLASMMGAAGLMEMIGGSLIILGLMTRPTAFVLVAEMLVAYAMAHLPQGGWPIENQGELALLYAAIVAFLAAHGAGPVSVDALIPFARHEERRHTPDRRLPHAA